jgi:hypothetical protein
VEHVRHRWGALNIGFVGHSISRAHRCVAGRSRVVMKRHLRSQLLNWLTNMAGTATGVYMPWVRKAPSAIKGRRFFKKDQRHYLV